MTYTLFVCVHDDSIKDYYKNYTTTYKNDSGVDLLIPSDYLISNSYRIDHMISCKMVRNIDNMNVSFYLYPRSSISKTPLIMVNSVGIIDSGYRGNIIACVRNLSNENYDIKRENKLFQICSPDLSPIKVVVVDSLDETDRGDKGFGSSNF